MILSDELRRYLQIRRGLGYDLSTTERVLKRFIAFAESEDATHITSKLFMQWQLHFGSANKSTWSRRLGMVRKFATWLHSFDPRHEIPPQALIPSNYKRKQPYIYTKDEIKRIIETAATLPSKNGLREITYPTLFGLISVTGLRISEAISLNDKDVDLENGIITLHNGKNGHSRILPVLKCTESHLKEYVRKRNRLYGKIPEPFFISDQGKRLTDCTARYNFATICKTIGLRPEQRFNKHGVGPRIHDLRHTFAVNVMLDWYQTGKNPDQEILKLITYMGHKLPSHTYWYIEAVPELLELASKRAENAIMQETKR